MEFAAAALASIASGIGSAGALATGIGSAGALATGIGSGLSWAGILGGGATVASALSIIGAGNEKAASLQLQAADAETNAALEGIQGLERRSSIKAALRKAIGERDVAAAASGVDLSFGTPVVARDAAMTDAERALEADQSTETFRRSRLLERAASYRMMASSAQSGALLKAAGLGLEGVSRVARRG